MKGDLKKIDNILKIHKIKQDGKIIDLSTVIESIVDKPSFYFQREKKINYLLQVQNIVELKEN